MINRVVFISVLMIISLTAAAGPSLNGKVVADTSVIPTSKTQITGRPLAEKVETEKKETDNTVKSKTVKSKVADNTSSGKTTAAPKKVTGKTAVTKKKPVIAGTADDGSTSTAVKTNTETSATKKTTGSKTKTNTESTAAKKTTSGNTTTTKKATATTTAEKATTNTNAKKAAAAYSPSKLNAASKAKSSKTKSRKLRKGIGIELYQPLAFKYAILLDVPVEKMIDDKLLEVLDHWYGTRYRFGGESRKGIDCSAFTQAFMLSYFDYELPRRAEEQYAKCKHIKKKKLRQGDLVFFKTKGPKGGITHVGVYLVNNRFVHSATSTGVRISDLGDDYYKEHYGGAGRIR